MRVQWTLHPERSGERATLLCAIQTFHDGVHVRTSPRHAALRVGHQGPTHDDHPNEV